MSEGQGEPEVGNPSRLPEPAPSSLPSQVPPSLGEAIELLLAVYKKVSRLEKRLEEQTSATDKLRAELKDLKKVVVRKKHLKRLKKVLDQLEVVELADDAPGGNHTG